MRPSWLGLVPLVLAVAGCGQGSAAPPYPGLPPAGPVAPPPGPSSANLSSVWDGRSTFTCNGMMNTRLTGMTVTLATGTAIRASGSCILRMVGMTVTAPVVLEVTDGAVVTVEGGRIVGSDKAIVATGTASVFIAGAVVVGAVDRGGTGTVHGVTEQRPTVDGVVTPHTAVTDPTAPPTATAPPVPPDPPQHVDLLRAALCCHLGQIPGCKRGPLSIRGTACAIVAERPACATCAAQWGSGTINGDPGVSLSRACPMCR